MKVRIKTGRYGFLQVLIICRFSLVHILQLHEMFTSSALCTLLGQNSRMPLRALQCDHNLSKNQNYFSVHNRISWYLFNTIGFVIWIVVLFLLIGSRVSNQKDLLGSIKYTLYLKNV